MFSNRLHAAQRNNYLTTARCCWIFQSRRWHVWLRDRIATFGGIERQRSARGSWRTFRMVVDRAAPGTDDARHRGRLDLQNGAASLLVPRVQRLCNYLYLPVPSRSTPRANDFRNRPHVA